MLRQLLSISVSLTTRRSRPTISLRTLDFSSEAVPEPASPAPDQASDPTSLPDGTKQIPRLAADVINRRWQQQLQAAAKEGDLQQTVAILEERCQRGARGLYTGKAFDIALRDLPPRLGLQVYHLARQWGIAPTSGMAISVIKMYTKLGMERHIESAVKEMVAMGLAPHWTTYFHWASAHAEAGLPDGVKAAMAAAEALGIQITAHYYTLLVKALCKAGKPGTTRILLQNLVDSGQIPPEPVWRTAIHCQGVAGRADHAQAMFDKMREVGVEPQLETWGSLVNAYAECYMPEKAMAAMNAMRAAGLRGNPQAYVALLKSCTHAASVPAALGAVRQMQEDGLTPNEHVWGALISACAAGGDAKAAREAFAAMRAANCPAGVVQYTALLTAHRNARDLAGGLQVLREMDAEGIAPTRETFTEIITLLGQHGMAREGEEAFAAMQAQGFTPDQISLNVLIGALLTNWVDSGRSPHSDLLAKADDVFHRGWATGVTRPLKHATGTTRLMRFDLHCQGTWSAQLALLAILAEIAQDAMRGVLPPALMLITGQGLKKGVAPLRETVRQLLVRMGMSVRVALGNEGTVIVPHGALVRAVKRSVRGDRPFDVFHWHEALVDPRTAKRGSGES